MSVAIFTDTNDQQQVYELLSYYQEKERCVDLEMPEDEWHTTLENLVKNLDLLFTESVPDNDVSGIINAIVSLVLLMPVNIQSNFVELLCTQIEKKINTTEKKTRIKHNALNTIFLGVTANELKLRCFEALLTEELNSDKKYMINLKLKEISEWLIQWNATNKDCQRIIRKLHQIYKERSDKVHSTESMMMLLRSFSKDNASDAREDGEQCIISALQDPSALTMDQILDLAPVQCLKGEPIYELLTIFVSGSIEDYFNFQETHPDFMTIHKLDKEVCLNKMRVLALMQLASGRDTTELDYSEIEESLQLPGDELESFIIEAVRQQAISCKLDQQQKKVLVAGAVPRRFAREQWEILGQDLELWSSNFDGIIEKLVKIRDAGQDA